MSDVSIMYSGGLDSFIAYHFAKSQELDPDLIYVDLGHPYAHKEKRAIERNGLPYKTVNMSDLYPVIEPRMTNQIIPSRNLLLAVIGGMLNGRVWVCALDGEQNGKERDKSPKFYDDTTALLTFINDFFQPTTVVETPFSKMTKADTIRWALDYGVSLDDLTSTISCYHPTHNKCGECLTCYKRYTAFLLAGVEEAGYVVNPLTTDYAKEMAREIPKAAENKDYTRFTERRVKEHFALQEIVGGRAIS